MHLFNPRPCIDIHTTCGNKKKAPSFHQKNKRKSTISFLRNYKAFIVMESTILLKKKYLFKIVELENLFKQKLITDLVILNKCGSFSGIVDK